MKKIFLMAAVALVFAGCKKDKEEDPAPAPPALSGYFMSATIDGENIKYTDGVKGIKMFTDIDGSGNEATFYCTFGKVEGGQVPNQVGLDFGYLPFSGSGPDEASFKAFFATGSRTWKYVSAGNGGVSVAYVDADTTLWYSGLGGQSNPIFTITSSKFRTKGSRKYMDVKADFTCTLYDGMGGSKAVTGGKFSGTFVDSE